MPIMRAQVVLQGKSNKPEDVFVNTFHFATIGSTAADVDVVIQHLTELYNTTPPAAGTIKLADYMSNTISRVADASRIKVYIVAPGPAPATPDPNPPVRDHRWTLAAPGSATGVMELPAELACCVSFYAGQNSPRTRGRIYFGPLIAMTEDGTNDTAVVPTGLRNSLVSAFTRLVTKPAATQNLAVYSRLDGLARPVTNGWVDNAWDIQRRRGQDATVRTVFP